MATHLVATADLLFVVDCNDACKQHEAQMVKVVVNANVVAVTCKVVPLVDIYSIALVCNNLFREVFAC